jgi:hypothetical protein
MYPYNGNRWKFKNASQFDFTIEHLTKFAKSIEYFAFTAITVRVRRKRSESATNVPSPGRCRVAIKWE